MCNRYAETADESEIRLTWPGIEWANVDLRPRWNVPPRDPAIALTSETPHIASWVSWGLLPHWASWGDGGRCLDARSETVAMKRSYRPAWETGKRCVLLATGYIEFTGPVGDKQGHLVQVDGGKLFALAGIWTDWHGEIPDTLGGRRVQDRCGPRVRTVAMLTTEPNEVARQVHPRMPVILEASEVDRWLGCNVDEATRMLRQFAPDRMGHRLVSRRVNSVLNDDPACLEPPVPR